MLLLGLIDERIPKDFRARGCARCPCVLNFTTDRGWKSYMSPRNLALISERENSFPKLPLCFYPLFFAHLGFKETKEGTVSGRLAVPLC